MDRLLLILGGISIAGVVAVLVSRRTPDPPSAPTHHVPTQLDRADFARPDAPWLVAVFTSSTCSTCTGVWERAQILASDDVVTQQLELGAQAALHERYAVDAVPMLVLADTAGVVRRAFLGPVTAADLWAAVAEARDADDGGAPTVVDD